ncbi:MAG: 50S ribosomal protein L4 [bacterium]|nr:50S ribosomal protein L4 [bacterium]
MNKSLIHEYYLLQMANARIAIAHTKTRAEVKGSGKKLYKQKGTGSARVGDKRSPIRRKGGVVFGPRKERNYTKDMPKKARKLALYGILSLRAKDGAILAFQ